MDHAPDIARIAALIGDPDRAGIVAALGSGVALSLAQLATRTGLPPDALARHLSRLCDGGLIRAEGPFPDAFYALRTDRIEGALHALTGHGPTPQQSRALRRAYLCCNHLGGDRGTQMFGSLLSHGHLVEEGENLRLSASGGALAQGFGIDLTALRADKPVLCRACPDDGCGRPHLAGSLGRAFLVRFEQSGWFRRSSGNVALRFTAPGGAAFDAMFPAPRVPAV